MDAASALIIISSCFKTKEFGINFYAKKVGLTIEYHYFIGQEAVSCMQTLFGISTPQSIKIGCMLLDSALISCRTFSSNFRNDNTRYTLNIDNNLSDEFIIKNLTSAVVTLSTLDTLIISKAFLEDINFVSKLDSDSFTTYLANKEVAISKLNKIQQSAEKKASATSNFNLTARKTPPTKHIIHSAPSLNKQKLPKSSSTSKLPKEKQRVERNLKSSNPFPRLATSKTSLNVKNIETQETNSNRKYENDSNIIFTHSDDSQQIPKIKSASVDKLIERLTHEVYPDIKFRSTFMLTYRSFMEPHDLLKKLTERFNLHNDVESVTSTIRLRVIAVVKAWIENYADDFIDDDSLNHELINLIENMETVMAAARGLKKKLNKRVEKHRADSISEKPLYPPSNEPLWLDIDETIVAHQLCIIEFRLYSTISAKEILNCNWSKHKTLSPNVLGFIDHFNRISYWVQHEIAKPLKVQDRITSLTKFINLAQKLFELNNYNGLNEVISGINGAPVRRLKKTWDGVPTKFKTKFKYLEALMSHEGSYSKYREILHHCDPPTVPYLGTYLSDLTFIEDGNPDMNGNLINFDKRYKIAAVIEELQQYQKIGYTFKPNPEVQYWLGNFVTMDEDSIYEISLKNEPRNTEEAIESLLIGEEKLREEIKTLQLKNSDLENDNRSLKLQLENATIEINRLKGKIINDQRGKTPDTKRLLPKNEIYTPLIQGNSQNNIPDPNNTITSPPNKRFPPVPARTKKSSSSNAVPRMRKWSPSSRN